MTGHFQSDAHWTVVIALRFIAQDDRHMLPLGRRFDSYKKLTKQK